MKLNKYHSDLLLASSFSLIKTLELDEDINYKKIHTTLIKAWKELDQYYHNRYEFDDISEEDLKHCLEVVEKVKPIMDFMLNEIKKEK